MQNVKTVPVVFHQTAFVGDTARFGQNHRAIVARQCTGTNNQHRAFGILQHVGKGMFPVSDLGQRLRTCTQLFHIIRGLKGRADIGDPHPAPHPTLANPGVDDRRFPPKV